MCATRTHGKFLSEGLWKAELTQAGHYTPGQTKPENPLTHPYTCSIYSNIGFIISQDHADNHNANWDPAIPQFGDLALFVSLTCKFKF